MCLMFSSGSMGQNMKIPNPQFLFEEGGKICSFEPPQDAKKASKCPTCIGIGAYYPLGMFGCHFELLSASSGAIGNFCQ